jgi:hypothetical protein
MTAYAIIFGILFVVAAAVAYAFYIQLSAVKGKEQTHTKVSDDSRAVAQKAARELEAAREELSRKRSELSELREKLNDIRTRQHKQREAERKNKGNAEAELQELLTITRRDLEDERARFDVLSRESKGMTDEIVRLREGQKKLDDALKAAQAAAAKVASAPAPATTAAAPSAPVVVAAPQKTDDELKARVELLDRQLRDARRKAAEQEEEAKKARGKASTVNRMQLLTKNELDLFKEKLVWSEKRVVELEKLLFDNKIALPEREAAPQPKSPAVAPGILARESANTGGEGVVAGEADYVPEAPTATEAPTTTEAPAAEAAPATTEAATSEASAVESTGPSAVPPIRRPKAAAEGQPELAAKSE